MNIQLLYPEKLKKLAALLDEAENLVSQFSGGYSNNFFSAEEFHIEFKKEIENLKNNGFKSLDNLYFWFAPTCDWDNFAGQDGFDLGNQIFTIILQLIPIYESKDIIELIQDYQNAANEVVKFFKEEYSIDNLLEAWHSERYEQTGNLKEYGLKFYAFHGIGLAAHFEDKIVDFDFAFFPEQRWDGFDVWRLKIFIDSQPLKYIAFKNEIKLEEEFEKLIDEGIISNPKIEFSTNLYFWTRHIKNKELKKKPTKIVDNGSSNKWWRFWAL